MNALENIKTQERFALTAGMRTKLRRAITANPGWKTVRETMGINASDLTSTRCFEVADILGIDAREAVSMDARAEAKEAIEAAKPAAAPEAPVAPVKAEKTPVAPAPTADTEKALAALQALLTPAVNPEQVKALVDAQIAPIADKIVALTKVVEEADPILVTVDREGREIGKVEGLRHKSFATLLAAMGSKMANGRAPNIWVTGPAGSGKTFAAKQAAQALNLPFAFHGAMTMAHELVGFVDAGGTYHETLFVKAYRDGGVILLDEVDAGSDEALLALNAALANGQMSLPNGTMIDRHDDFICLAAGNTYGTGPTAEYVGRARIDAAFLDRFGVKIAWEYDNILERKICGNEEWAERVQKARRNAEKHGLKVMITPRASETGAALIAGGMSEDEAAKLTYLAGLSAEQVSMVEGS